MNCQKGDLAVIVSGTENIGRIVTVLAVSELHGAGWWYVEIHGSPGTGTWHGTNERGHDKYGHISDRRLRPIRDPGDDAQDETLDWLQVPTKQGEPA
jgi:hypothetical protein